MVAAVYANDENTLRIILRAGCSLTSTDPSDGRLLLRMAMSLVACCSNLR